MWSLRNILGVLLLVFAIVMVIIEYQGGFKTVSEKALKAVDDIQNSASSSLPSPKPTTDSNSKTNVDTSPTIEEKESFINRTWLYENRVKVGIILVIVMCIGGIIFTKKFFDGL